MDNFFYNLTLSNPGDVQLEARLATADAADDFAGELITEKPENSCFDSCYMGK